TSSQDIGELILVGSKSLSQQQFSFQFDSDYEDLMKILEKIPSADPLMLVSGFVIERIDKDDVGEPIPGTPFVTIPLVSGDVRKLDIELKLITFTEVSPDEPIWSSGKK
ncbi:MAG: hypothetical protein KKH25_02290, partial [Candidatus Omnitrophica bacterium]|nr:hypothetical protein [Candidatus Omnitrophota bacterium]